MATFKAEVYEHHKKTDGSYNVKIRVTHLSKKRYLSTSVYVFKDDMTRSLKIKDQDTLELLDQQVKLYYNDIKELGGSIDYLNVDDIVKHIKQKDRERIEGVDSGVDFFSFVNNMISNMESEGRKGTADTYKTMRNSLIKFIGEKLTFSDITVDFLNRYESHLKEQGCGARSISHYPSMIRAVFNNAINTLNDYDTNRIIIKGTPFAKYKIKKEPPAEKRSISVEHLCKIRDLKGVKYKRSVLAQDIFMLSFYLCGMNSVDLYSCDTYVNGRIVYNRKKTASRRKDHAKMSILVPDVAKRILDKYKDPTNERVFNFYKQYTTHQNFNKALNDGLNVVGEMCGIDKLQFYSARHAFASIARNKCKLPLDYVSQALNHSSVHTTTELYIEEDWSIVDTAQKSVIRYLIKEASKKKAE